MSLQNPEPQNGYPVVYSPTAGPIDQVPAPEPATVLAWASVIAACGIGHRFRRHHQPLPDLTAVAPRYRSRRLPQTFALAQDLTPEVSAAPRRRHPRPQGALLFADRRVDSYRDSIAQNQEVDRHEP